MAKQQQHDALGNRMKTQYENRSRFYLARRSFTIIRIDGKAFHTWTKGLDRPFDARLVDCMAWAAEHCFKDFMGCKLAYGQSDEYSFVLTDFDKIETEAWFDGNIQKISSVAASAFTAYFNARAHYMMGTKPPAMFDARVFQIPDYEEVLNYLVWRQQDAERNSIQMLAQSLYSHKQLHGKKTPELHELIHQKGKNWAKEDARFKRGTVIWRNVGDAVKEDLGMPNGLTVDPAPIFTKSRAWLKFVIPCQWAEDRAAAATA